MAATGEDKHHGLSLRFEVSIDGHELGGWAKCDGLNVTCAPVTYDEGGSNTFTWKAPGRISYENIKLTRACTKDDTKKVFDWFSKVASQPQKGTASIKLFDAWQKEVFTWSLRGVFPLSWKGPQLDASNSKVALEVLELAHEGFLET